VTPLARLCALSAMTLLLAAAVGCGRVERLPSRAHAAGPTPPGTEASASRDGDTPAPYPFTPAPVVPTPTVLALPETTTSACAGRPSISQVIAALRRDRDLLPANVTPRATTGPLCAGPWQYTVIDVSGHDPLQVVTRGSVDSLTVVTAGTYVCTPEVAGTAPPGILAAAHCR
jgi:hypothetical protein